MPAAGTDVQATVLAVGLPGFATGVASPGGVGFADLHHLDAVQAGLADRVSPGNLKIQKDHKSLYYRVS